MEQEVTNTAQRKMQKGNKRIRRIISESASDVINDKESGEGGYVHSSGIEVTIAPSLERV
ncbi:MAG: hypothetical protein PVS2B2_12230 [Candidatus Acidiferrum sp.]